MVERVYTDRRIKSILVLTTGPRMGSGAGEDAPDVLAIKITLGAITDGFRHTTQTRHQTMAYYAGKLNLDSEGCPSVRPL